MSENVYINIYRSKECYGIDGFDFGVIEHRSKTNALRLATPEMGGYQLVAAAVPVTIDPECAKHAVEHYQQVAKQFFLSPPENMKTEWVLAVEPEAQRAIAQQPVTELIEAARQLRARQRDYLSQPKGNRSEEKGRLVGEAAERLDAALANISQERNMPIQLKPPGGIPADVDEALRAQIERRRAQQRAAANSIDEAVRDALHKAFLYGEWYRQQVDSESYKQVETMAEFKTWADETAATLATAQQQQGQPPDWYARREQHAREMGYTGLAEALDDLEQRRQATEQGGGAVAWFPTNAQGEIIRNYGDGSPVYACRTKEEAEQAKRCHLGATGPVIPLYAAPPPSAPVGEVCIRLNGIGEGGPYPVVNGVCVLPQSVAENLVASTVGQQVKRELLAQWASYKQPAAPSGEAVATVAGEFSEVRQDGEVYWLQTVLLKRPQQLPFGTLLYTAPQQPAAVDGARFRKAPCYRCGYNGPGYFQPETHPCAALYHATQHQEPKS